MSAHKQGDEVPSAGAAAAPAPTAGEKQQSKGHPLEEEIRELEADIKELRKKIKSDEGKADLTKNEDLELALRRAIAANTERLQGLEQDMRDLRKKIERPTAAGGRSPTSCLPLRSLIGLPRRVLRALLLLREFDIPFHLRARTATRHTRRFARVVRSSSVHVHHASLCIDGVALSLPHRVRASSHLVHAPRFQPQLCTE
jgi:small-conductance mechanosensitive channel